MINVKPLYRYLVVKELESDEEEPDETSSFFAGMPQLDPTAAAGDHQYMSVKVQSWGPGCINEFTQGDIVVISDGYLNKKIKLSDGSEVLVISESQVILKDLTA